MGKSLVIAEKYKVAVNIANALKAKKIDGYFENDKYVITSASGHLLKLYNAEDYDLKMKTWKINNFPFIPSDFKYKVIGTREKEIINTIKKLYYRDDIDLVINVCDADREGELIFWETLNYVTNNKIEKPVKRVWLNEWTYSDIKKGFKNLKDYKEVEGLKHAGYSRQLADWIIGINFTSVTTLKYGNNGTSNTLLNVGRVIMPTIKLIYDRDMEIKNFKPEIYYEVTALFSTEVGKYKGIYIADDKSKEKKIKDKKLAETIKESILNQEGKIIQKDVYKTTKNPPRLFNMTDLQGNITRKYNGFSAKKVLDIAQELYEKGYISYPRTKSRHLEETLKAKVKRTLEILSKDKPYKDLIKFKDTKDIFDNSKVDSHSAIRPTEKIPSALSKYEKVVYDEIVKRFLAQFMPPLETEVTEIKTKVKDYLFLTKGNIVINKGWRLVYSNEDKIVDDKLPNLKEGMKALVADVKNEKKETKPPNHYTDATLLSAMENCGEKVQDIERLLKGYQIGTDATRAGVLEKIQKVGYVEKKGKSFYITPLGEKLINVFPVKKLFDVDYTGELEKKLKDIELGNYSQEEFLSEIIKFTKEGIKIMKKKGTNIVDIKDKAIGICPECKSYVIENKYGFKCSNENCKFMLWKEDKFLKLYKKKTTKKMAIQLLKNKKVFVKGFVSKKGTKFDAELVLYKNGDYWNFAFNFDSSKKVIGKCPECGERVVETAKSFKCLNKDCNFIIWKEDKFLSKFGVKVTSKIAKELINNKEVYIKDMYSQKKNKKFNATIKMVKEGEYWNFKFEF